jgi:MFS family permease
MVPLSTGALGLAVAAVVVGLGNGWGSGLLMTLGADIAPRRSRAVFIGLWMVLGDVGSLVGPALVSAVTLISLSAGIAGVGVLGLGSAALLQIWIPPGRGHNEGTRTSPQ